VGAEANTKKHTLYSNICGCDIGVYEDFYLPEYNTIVQSAASPPFVTSFQVGLQLRFYFGHEC
jgi:hypothetical protein